jgi:hypothetical protein
VCQAIKEVASRLVDKEIESLFADMGKAWDHLVADSQLRWLLTLSLSNYHTEEAELHYDVIIGSVPKRVLFILPPPPWTTLSGICTLGLVRNHSGSLSSI